MTNPQAGHINALLEQIHAGQTEQALAELARLLLQQPTHAQALALRAEALRL